jgi:hypothetical protein
MRKKSDGSKKNRTDAKKIGQKQKNRTEAKKIGRKQKKTRIRFFPVRVNEA